MRPRPPTNPEALVRYRVGQLRDKFEYPDEIGGGAPPVAGGGGGAPTVVVAASDASDLSKSKADFICTGVNDEQVIQAAIDSLTDGGLCWLTEGTFECQWRSGGVSVINSNENGASIRGLGIWATVIIVNGSPSAVDQIVVDMGGLGAKVGDLRILDNQSGTTSTVGVTVSNSYCTVDNVLIFTQGPAIDIVSGSFAPLITNCRLDGTNDVGIRIASGNLNAVITDNQINAAANGITNLSSGIIITDNHISFGSGFAGIRGTGINAIIIDNYIIGSGFGVHNEGDQDWFVANNTLVQTNGMFFDVASDNTTIVNNRFDTGGQILFDGGSFDGCKVSGNIWDVAQSPTVDGVIVFDNGAVRCQITDNLIESAAGMDGIRVESGTDVLIANNMIGADATNGIVVNSGTRVQVDGNTIRFPGEHGIDYVGSDGSIINNLVFGASQNTTNMFDNIHLSGDSDNNFIHGNQLLAAATAPLTRYAINISAATCDCNRVVGNSGSEAAEYGTGTINDAGTLTQLLWPADPSDGDNLFGCSGS